VLTAKSIRTKPRNSTMDAVYILITIALFASSFAFIRLCERV